MPNPSPTIDWLWTSQGGLLLDGAGDIACTGDITSSVVDIARSRLKAALDGWKLYRTGADLESYIGNAVSQEIETAVSRRVHDVLTNNLLPEGSFDIRTLAFGSFLEVYVYVSERLVLKVVSQTSGGQLQVITL